jgi:hypothetical protein
VRLAVADDGNELVASVESEEEEEEEARAAAGEA